MTTTSTPSEAYGPREFFSFARALGQASRTLARYARLASRSFTYVISLGEKPQQSKASVHPAQQPFSPGRELALVGVQKRRRPIRERARQMNRELDRGEDRRLA